jgi:ornithine decarboxylase
MKNPLNLATAVSYGFEPSAHKSLLRELAAAQKTFEPFCLVDLGDVYRKHKTWLKNIPRVEPFYALKCNSDLAIGKSIASLGGGFDCASQAEIAQVLSYGVSAKNIIYAHPCKPPSHIEFAKEQGVELMTFDNEDELVKIQSIYPEAKLVVRVHTGESKAICKLGKKFGAAQEDIPELLSKASSLNLNVVGVSFHIGSGCLDATAFSDAIKIAKGVFNDAERVGYKLSLLDIGGGFPGDSNAPVPFGEIADVVNNALDVHFPVGSDVRIIAEPGRYYVASSTTLAVSVVSKRRIKPSQPSEQMTYFYYVNDGTYGSLNNVMYDHASPVPITLKEDYAGPLYTSVLWGPTCDSMDCITREALLPDVPLGDWFIFENAGAYTVAAGSTFNGFPRPQTIYTFSAPSSFNPSDLPADFPIEP